MVFYYPDTLFDGQARWHIFPLLKALLKEKDHSHLDFSIGSQLETADCVILPMSWNYYYSVGRITDVMDYYSTLPQGMLVVSFVFGDFGVQVPKAFTGLVFRTSGHRSQLPAHHVGMPVFIEDPVDKYYSNRLPLTRNKSSLATVGFCGQARGAGFQTFIEWMKTAYRNFKSQFGLSVQDKQDLMSTTYLRWRLLNFLKQSDLVSSNFILRESYRAGVQDNKDFHDTTLAFYNNIEHSDYVLCVRGAGNFSTRFYETLSMGRIPVFVNTDCLLPLQGIIDWNKHLVWVEVSNKADIPQAVKCHYDTFNLEQLRKQMFDNRTLWVEHLQLYSFFKTFFNAYKNTITGN